MSYTGNDWQSENANMLQAMAKTKTYRDKVDLQVHPHLGDLANDGRRTDGNSGSSTLIDLRL